MNKKDILYKAIEKAENNNYKEHLKYLPVTIGHLKDYGVFAKTVFFAHKDEIIYSKEFAQAFFGEHDVVYSKNAWVRRLEEMSQTQNEFEYLEKFL